MGSEGLQTAPSWHQEGPKETSRRSKTAKRATCQNHCKNYGFGRFFGVPGPPLAPSWAALGPQEGPRRLQETHPKQDPNWDPKLNHFGAQNGPPKAVKNRVKRHPKRVHFRVSLLDPPREPQERPKIGPREAQDAPREAQERPKRGPRGPKRGSREAQEAPRDAQERPKRAPRELQGAQESTRRAQDEPQRNPRSTQQSVRGPKKATESCNWIQDGLWKLQRAQESRREAEDDSHESSEEQSSFSAVPLRVAENEAQRREGLR